MTATEEMKIWLFDLAHGNIDGIQAVQGFVRYYVLNGRVIGSVVDDIIFRTGYGPEGARIAKQTLEEALEDFSVTDFSGVLY